MAKLSLARNTSLNLLGFGVPLLAALLVVPALVERLGLAKFGFLALAWALVGYFSLFDLGIGRLLTRSVAEAKAESNQVQLRALCKSGLTIAGALGIVTGMLLFVGADWLCASLIRLPANLVVEGAAALRVLALCVPFVTLTAALRGMLEGGQHFASVNLIRLSLGVFTFAGPAMVVLVTTDLTFLAWVLVGLRCIFAAAHWWVAARAMPQLVGFGWPDAGPLKAMISYGLWITASNIVGPIIVYADRFMLAGLAGVAAVGLYAAPYEIITKAWLFPAAISSSLFPVFATSARDATIAVYAFSIKAIVLIVGPLAVAGALLAPEWLGLWLGQAFAQETAAATRILCLGILSNCIAYIPLALLQAKGRPDLPAKIHLALLPAYVIALAVAVGAWGIAGAALVWAVRNLLDAVALCACCVRAGHVAWPKAKLPLSLVGVLLLAGGIASVCISDIGFKWIFLFAYIPLFALTCWRFVLDGDEREWIRVRMKPALAGVR